MLLADDAITLGRSDGSTIMIDDPAVSRIHMNLEYDPRSSVYTVNGLGSSNGTLVNGKTTKTRDLSEGDKIIVGQTVLRFSWIDAVDRVFHGEVDRLINIDGLTGLVVKRRFDEEFSRHVAVALRDRDSFVYMMMTRYGWPEKLSAPMGIRLAPTSISETGKIIKT